MRFLKSYQNFNINEKENTSYSPLTAYKAVALGVSRVFNMLGYFYSIARPDADPKRWKSEIDKISNVKDYKLKWDGLSSLVSELQSDIEKYASKRRMDEINPGRFFDVGTHSRSIPVALEKFKAASDILTKDLPVSKIRERLSLINQGLPKEPYKLEESALNENSKKKRAPGESEMLMLADNLSSSVTQALSTARNLKQLFPDSVSFIDSVIARYITPASDKIKEILETQAPDPSLKLSKSVRKSYERKGWNIDTVREKYLADQYEDLIDLEDLVLEGVEKINKAKENISDELAPSSDAGEFIDAGNRILDSIEDKIAEKERVKDLRRRAQLMIPVAQDEPIPSTQTTTTVRQKELVSTDELRRLLQRRISR
jgi:hypothetical protein